MLFIDMQFAHLLAAILYGSNEIYFPSHQRDCNVGLNAEQGLSQLTFIYALLLEVYDYFFVQRQAPQLFKVNAQPDEPYAGRQRIIRRFILAVCQNDVDCISRHICQIISLCC